MEITKELRKELRAVFRAKVAGGQYASRKTLLAYAFVKGVPYDVLEHRINEDKFPVEGRNTFLKITLGNSVGRAVYSAYRELYDEEKSYVKLRQIQVLVNTWIMKKYESAQESAA